MNLQPPQPPTVPAPAIRPTPPTPPRIDKAPFVRQSDDTPQVTRKVETPEDMARDAVAHGSGALTKRTVGKNDDEPQQQAAPATQKVEPLKDTQSDYDRGQDVLREFRDLDAREAQSTYEPPAQTSTEQPQHVTPRLNHQEGHGGFYWIFTILFVAIAAFIIVKKFLLTDKPALTKSQLFEDAPSKLKAVTDKVKPVTPSKPTLNETPNKVKATADKVEPVTPPPKPVKLPPKQDDNKGKHFEIRV